MKVLVTGDPCTFSFEGGWEDQNVVTIATPSPARNGRLRAPGLYWSVTLYTAFTTALTRDFHVSDGKVD